MSELALANLTVAEATPLELVDAAASAGFASVNVWLTPPPSMALFARLPSAPLALVGDANATAAFRRRLDATGVRMWTGSAGWFTADFDRAMLAPALETVAALGGRSVATVGWDPDRARLVAHFAAACAAAAPLGLDVNLEFMPYSAVRTLADACAVLAAAAQPNAGLIVDALHLARSGGTPADVARVAPEQLACVQLCDAPAEAPPEADLRTESVRRRLYPGDGALPLRALLEALPRDVVVEVETPVAADADLDVTARARRSADAARRYLAA